MSKEMSVEERLSKTSFEIYEKPHIIVDTEICKTCKSKPCLRACPARLYQLDNEGNITFNYEGCLECGTCRIVCPFGAVKWNYPPGGFGVHYRFG